MPECRADATIPAPWPLVTSDDFHRRRPGEPQGYVPAEGDRIRYALRHTHWCPAAGCMVAGHDEPEEFRGVVTVIGAFERDGETRYTLRHAGGDLSWIDLDWWITEHVLEDGALW
ncbi:MAG TPA: hypothetical protein VN041_09245 [Microbacterium sp.]|nr:hypothetical protein [Microbacterium sp.]